MAIYGKTNEQNYQNIAATLRRKSGRSNKYKPSEMAPAINSLDAAILSQGTFVGNGVFTVPEGADYDGWNSITVQVSNTYLSADEGKVVSNASLVSQSSLSIISNGTFDTTLNNEVVVDVEGTSTDDATLSSGSQMLSGITAYARGSKYTGTIPMYNGSINSGSGSVPSYDYYSGSYTITPSTVSQAFPTAGKIMSSDLTVEAYSLPSSAETYSGSYTITPSVFSQAFPTAGKLMSQDLTVEAYSIDYYSGSYVVVPSTTSVIVSTAGKTLLSDLQINAYSSGSGGVPYAGPYSVAPSFLQQVLSTSGKVMVSDLTINPVGDMVSVTISENGVHLPSEYSAFGFSQIYVQVYPHLTDIKYVNKNTFAHDSLLSRVTTSGSNVIAIDELGFFDCENLESVSFPICSEIGKEAFRNCVKLADISFPICEKIGKSAFWSCYSLASASFSLVSVINSDAFHQCSSLSQVSFPICGVISNNAFMSCIALESAIFPSVSEIGKFAFADCSSLSGASFPICEKIGESAFFGCSMLNSLSLPLVSMIDGYAFMNCDALSVLNLPSCKSISNNAFYGVPLQDISLPLCEYIEKLAFASCSVSQLNLPNVLSIGEMTFMDASLLENVSIPNCRYVEKRAFDNCEILSKVVMSMVSMISDAAFQFCSALSEVYILSKYSVANIGSDVFYSTPIGSYSGIIYVPSVIYSLYANDSRWWNYHLSSVTDEQIEALLS